MTSANAGTVRISAPTPSAVSTTYTLTPAVIPTAASTPPRRPADTPEATTKAMSGPGATQITRTATRNGISTSGEITKISFRNRIITFRRLHDPEDE